MPTLTKKQKDVLNFITSYINKHGLSPTIEETAKHFKRAVGTIHEHVEELAKKGFIKKNNSVRGIEVDEKSEMIKIPLLGNIAAGQPIEAIETINQTISIPKKEINSLSKYYALKVVGDSMIDEGIFDGDTVVIKQQNNALNGETVVAIIDENGATLKKFYREKNRIRLQPANLSLFPIYRKEVEIRGVVVKIIRNFQIKKDTDSTIKPSIPNTIDDRKNTSIEKKLKSGIFKTGNLKLNNIYNLDCFELLSQIKENSIDLVFADPPYNLSKSNFKIKFVKSGGSDLNTNKGAWDKFSDNDFEEFTKKWLTECYRILKPNGSIWVAGTYHNIYLTGYLMKKMGFEILNEILWHKSDATPNLSCTRFVADHENFIWARKGKGNIFNYKEMKALNGGTQMRSIWTRGKTSGGKKIHPTQKPEWLLDRIILATSHPDSIVFDPFLGSGTTAVVAKKLKRSFLGCEIDKEYFKKSLERINNTTLCQATI